jgi:3-hydroxyisobutyrate dehydrogenase-like beta-hydroxyacid dehydrogenase
MAAKMDIPMEKMIEILARPDGIARPLEHRMRERMANADYAGGMSVSNARKDSTLALETAQDLGVPLFATLAAHTPYEIAHQVGYGDLDYAALAKLWESWCDVHFAP